MRKVSKKQTQCGVTIAFIYQEEEEEEVVMPNTLQSQFSKKGFKKPQCGVTAAFVDSKEEEEGEETCEKRTLLKKCGFTAKSNSLV